MNLENKEDNYSYEQGVLLADEILSVLRSGSEKSDLRNLPQIAEWIKDNPYADELIAKLCNEEELAGINEQYFRKNAALQVTRFYEHIERKKLRKRLLRIAVSVCGAAAIVLVFLFITIRNENRMIIPETKSFAVEQQITQPTLILKSGERVELEDNNYTEQIKQISQNVDPEQLNRLIIPPKCKFRLELEDGSIVFLNADSELSYPIHFSGNSRKVFLHRGEAYFEVTKSEKQFEVNIDNTKIKVYGTKFNVSYYSPKIMQTVLIEGSLGVALNSINETIIHPGELITVNNINGDKEIKSVNTRKYLTWVNGFVCCDEDSLKLLLEQVSRWYNVEFVVDGNVDTMLLVNAYFSVERPLEEILKSIEDIATVKFTKIEGGKYMVK